MKTQCTYKSLQHRSTCPHLMKTLLEPGPRLLGTVPHQGAQRSWLTLHFTEAPVTKYIHTDTKITMEGSPMKQLFHSANSSWDLKATEATRKHSSRKKSKQEESMRPGKTSRSAVKQREQTSQKSTRGFAAFSEGFKFPLWVSSSSPLACRTGVGAAACAALRDAGPRPGLAPALGFASWQGQAQEGCGNTCWWPPADFLNPKCTLRLCFGQTLIWVVYFYYFLITLIEGGVFPFGSAIQLLHLLPATAPF